MQVLFPTDENLRLLSNTITERRRQIAGVDKDGLAGVEKDELAGVDKDGLARVEKDELATVEKDELARVEKNELARVEKNEQTHSQDKERTCSPRGTTQSEGRPDGVIETETGDGGMESLSCTEDRLLSVQDFIKVVTSDRVISVIADSLLEEFNNR